MAATQRPVWIPKFAGMAGSNEVLVKGFAISRDDHGIIAELVDWTAYGVPIGDTITRGEGAWDNNGTWEECEDVRLIEAAVIRFSFAEPVNVDGAVFALPPGALPLLAAGRLPCGGGMFDVAWTSIP